MTNFREMTNDENSDLVLSGGWGDVRCLITRYVDSGDYIAVDE